jgi:hypothetical protein
VGSLSILLWESHRAPTNYKQLSAQFNVILGQENKQIEKPRAALSWACSYKPSDFVQAEDESRVPWTIVLNQKRQYGDEQFPFLPYP